MDIIQLKVGGPEYNEIIKAATIAGVKVANENLQKFKWVPKAELMKLLNVSGRQVDEMRKNGIIEHSKLSHKVIMYNLDSVDKLLTRIAIKAK